MNRFFVYYDYDYHENGGVGFESFPTKTEALAFINERHRLSSESKITDWTLIEGRELQLSAVERITEITA
jgi:hypothetical protein